MGRKEDFLDFFSWATIYWKELFTSSLLLYFDCRLSHFRKSLSSNRFYKVFIISCFSFPGLELFRSWINHFRSYLASFLCDIPGNYKLFLVDLKWLIIFTLFILLSISSIFMNYIYDNFGESNLDGLGIGFDSSVYVLLRGLFLMGDNCGIFLTDSIFF